MKGSIVALVTPFNVNNEIDYLELFHLIDYQIENEIEGIVFHRGNGDMCKIKRTDFNFMWNNKNCKH